MVRNIGLNEIFGWGSNCYFFKRVFLYVIEFWSGLLFMDYKYRIYGDWLILDLGWFFVII